jgi:unsaturated chondroitin disaccharide hydrolase
MQKILFVFLGLFLFLSCKKSVQDSEMQEWIGSLSQQLKELAGNIPDDKVPRSYDEKTGYWMVGNSDWTCGFPAGMFWLMYEMTEDPWWKEKAEENTLKLEGVQYHSGTHDLGFMVFCSYGNAYRLTGEDKYREVILQASETLSRRFHPVVGSIKSWDWSDQWQFPVIVDNMMNLEMLFWASRESGNPKYKDIAVTHANTTLKNHFREEMSSVHVVDYDTLTGKVLIRETHQGLYDESSWGRGQAWGLYGFVVCYRETGDPRYLEAAEKIADYILRNLPEDGISYWDFNDPAIPETNRDASAAAITASALFELSNFSQPGERYRTVANKIIRSLSSEKYRAPQGENGGFLLKHSVGNKPANSEVDVAINYADYYYLEALKRKFEYEKTK